LSGKNRYFVLVTVAGAHALVLGVLLGESRNLRLSSPGGTPLTAFILMRPARLRPPWVHRARGGGAAPIAPLVAPVTIAPPAAVAMRANGRAVDWEAAARQAAAAALERGKRISFGFPAGGKSAITLGVPSPSTPAHYAGESDRTPGGEVTEWISDRCYIISDPPVPGTPDFLKNARVTRGGCLPPPGPDPGELFKSLPVYRKLHPPQ
jgi:hypothetical protein